MSKHQVRVDRVSGGQREEFLHAIELARVSHDPAEDWEAFREALWTYLIRVFGLEGDEGWPEDLPDPRGGVSGDADTVAEWMRERLASG